MVCYETPKTRGYLSVEAAKPGEGATQELPSIPDARFQPARLVGRDVTVNLEQIFVSPAIAEGKKGVVRVALLERPDLQRAISAGAQVTVTNPALEAQLRNGAETASVSLVGGTPEVAMQSSTGTARGRAQVASIIAAAGEDLRLVVSYPTGRVKTLDFTVPTLDRISEKAALFAEGLEGVPFRPIDEVKR